MQKQRRFNRESSWRCVEYWLAKGYSLDQAHKQISNKQSEISVKQKGKIVTDTARSNLRAAALKRNTEEYWYERYGDNAESYRLAYKKRLSENGRKSAKNRNNLTSTPRRKEFWMKRGYTEEQAKNKVSDTQATFTLAKCVEKYSEELGVEIWNKRQQKWRKSFEQNDMEHIKLKMRNNASPGFYSLDNVPTYDLLFYLLLIKEKEEQWIKYGLTKHNVTKRWGRTGRKLNYTILYQKRFEPRVAVNMETSIRERFGKQHDSSYFKLTELVQPTKIFELCEIISPFDSTVKEIINEQFF